MGYMSVHCIVKVYSVPAPSWWVCMPLLAATGGLLLWMLNY